MPPADERLKDQLRLILGAQAMRDYEGEVGPDADGLEGAAAFPPDWEDVVGDVEYLYREHSVLVRAASLARARTELIRILPDGVEIDEFAVHGVIRLTWRWPEPEPKQGEEPRGPLPTTPQVLDGFMIGRTAVPGLDERIGVGVATPDHVLSLCGHPCPATEPEEVPRSAVPFPPVSTGLCCCPVGRCGSRRFCDGQGAVVVIVDGGLLRDAPQTHSWLAGVTGDTENPYENGRIRPYAGHGTFVAGCVRCVAPRASVIVKRAPVAEHEQKAGAAFETTVAETIGEALELGPDIIVCEYSAESRKDLQLISFDDLYESRIRPLKGLVLLAPAGNEGKRFPTWPAAHTGVLSVGALSADWRTRASFSNYGGWVDVYAPGEQLVNAFAKGLYVCNEDPDKGQLRRFRSMARWSGTSFSTPLVAGLIAARMSATGESASRAADALLRFARSQAMPGVGPVLFPDQAGCGQPGCSCAVVSVPSRCSDDV